jgi:hypothetical protein
MAKPAIGEPSVDLTPTGRACARTRARIGLRAERNVMADNVVFFDKFHRLKRKLPGFGTTEFQNAYAEARALVHVAEANFLCAAELNHLTSKLSPFALCLVRAMVKQIKAKREETQNVTS